MMEWLAALEAAAPIAALRDSVWVYPLVNAGHILGIALLVGAILPLDLRLLGCWPSLALPPLWTLLSRTAACGLLLAVGCGMLLFATDATEYVESSLFITKQLFVIAGITNAITLHLIAPKAIDAMPSHSGTAPVALRVAAGISLLNWPVVLVLGRLVGYF